MQRGLNFIVPTHAAQTSETVLAYLIVPLSLRVNAWVNSVSCFFGFLPNSPTFHKGLLFLALFLALAHPDGIGNSIVISVWFCFCLYGNCQA